MGPSEEQEILEEDPPPHVPARPVPLDLLGILRIPVAVTRSVQSLDEERLHIVRVSGDHPEEGGFSIGGGGGSCPPEPRRSRHRPWRRGSGLQRSARSRSSSLPGRRPEPVQLPATKGMKFSAEEYRGKLVEAGGVEPPSDDSQRRAATCVSGRLDLVPGDPGRQGSLRTIPGESSPCGPPGGGIGLSREVDALPLIRAFGGRTYAA